MHIFQNAQFYSPPYIKKKVAQFMAGMKRTAAKEMQEPGVTCEEGKYPMDFPVFKRFPQLMEELVSAEHVYAMLCLTLELILISRLDHCVNYHVNNLRWRDDSMIIFFHKSNNNQFELDKNFPWYIHINPMLPECCPVHTMGMYFFTNPHIINNNSRILPGKRQYRHYSYLLKNFIEGNKEDIANGGSVDNLGSQYIQK